MSSTDNAAPVGLTDEQRAYIDGLRAYADFLEANPEIAGRTALNHVDSGGEYFCGTAGTAEGLVRLSREAGGKWDKEVGSDYFRLTRAFGPHRFSLFVSRGQVCERVVRTETVTREVPDPEKVAEIPTVTVTEEIEHVEWVCPPSLLAAGSESW